jgi:hypothetical protein
MGKMVGIANPSAYGGLAKGRVRLSAEVSPMADIQHRDSLITTDKQKNIIFTLQIKDGSKTEYG